MTCSWTPDPGCLANSWDELDPAVQERSLLLATSSLLTLTYNRVGTCPITIRPVTDPCEPCAPGRTLCEVALPGPVGFVSRFVINGEEQDINSDDWRLDDGHILVWQGT